MVDAFLDAIPGWLKFVLGGLATAALFIWRGGWFSGQLLRDFNVVKSDIAAFKAANIVSRIEAIGRDIRALTDSGLLKRFETVEQDVQMIKKHMYDEHNGLRVMTEDRHTEICGYSTEAVEKELERLQVGMAELRSGVKELRSEYLTEARAMRAAMDMNNAFVANISEMLGKAWKMDSSLRVPRKTDAGQR